MSREASLPKLGFVISILLLVGVVVFSVRHVGEARRFATLIEHAEPLWVILAVALQVGTYVCAGTIWGRVAAAAGHPLPTPKLARLSVEKLTVDQFVPTGGLAGNVVVISAMRRMGLEAAIATEALLIDLLSHYAAFSLSAVVAVLVLRLHHGVTPVLVLALSVFALLVAGVPIAIAWILRHRDWRPGPRLSRIRSLTRAMDALDKVEPRRVWNPRLLATAAALQAAIYVLDAATLWAMLKALGMSVHPLTAFVALIMASIAGMVSFLPGGIGTYEAASIATLSLLGTPVEAALTGTFMLRALTLWLPLLPGAVLARRDLRGRASSEG